MSDHLESLSVIAAPLTELICKTSWNWTLLSVLFLRPFKLLNFEESMTAPIRHVSAKFNSAQLHYSTMDQELLAVLHRSVEMATYLQQVRLIIGLDHMPLQTYWQQESKLTLLGSSALRRLIELAMSLSLSHSPLSHSFCVHPIDCTLRALSSQLLPTTMLFPSLNRHLEWRLP